MTRVQHGLVLSFFKRVVVGLILGVLAAAVGATVFLR